MKVSLDLLLKLGQLLWGARLRSDLILEKTDKVVGLLDVALHDLINETKRRHWLVLNLSRLRGRLRTFDKVHNILQAFPVAYSMQEREGLVAQVLQGVLRGA